MPAAASASFHSQPRVAPGSLSRVGGAPCFPVLPREGGPRIVQAIGSRCWSTDGFEYIDFDNAGGAVLLGHRHPAVVEAVRAAREIWDGKGADRIRDEVEARLLDTAPWAEAVLFGADVSQAMRAAMTCARLATGRRQVLTCRSSVWRSGAQTASFPFDDLPALDRMMEEHGADVAALVLAPRDAMPPSPGYLEGVRLLVDRHGALLIFDETLSGFRVHEGGAQALYGVRADLAVYGESLANGMPLGALVGPRQLIEAGGDPPLGELRADLSSLAAAQAVLTKIQDEPVISALRIGGAEVQAALRLCLESASLQDVVKIVGDPAASRIGFCPPLGIDPMAMKALWVGEYMAQRLFSQGDLNMSHAHGESEIAVLLHACGQAAERLASALRSGHFPRHRGSDPFSRLMVQ